MGRYTRGLVRRGGERTRGDLTHARRRRRLAQRGVVGGFFFESVAEEVGKPGTNWLQVDPAARKRLGPLVRHYMKKPRPFTACVRDNTKRFGKERAERICAVVKDLGMRSTRWRKGRVREEEMEEALGLLMEAADGDVDGLEWYMLAVIREQEESA